jgi:HSP20 family protein
MLYARVMTAPVFGLRREIDRLFEDTFGRGQAGLSPWTPAVDIRESDEALTFAVELPGIKPEDLTVTTNDGVLTIQGERAAEREEGEGGRYHLVERHYGSFMRQFQLPQGVDTEKIEADVEDGMLRVSIPKAALPQPKQIRIKTVAAAGSRTQQALATGEPRKESPKKLAGASQTR